MSMKPILNWAESGLCLALLILMIGFGGEIARSLIRLWAGP